MKNYVLFIGGTGARVYRSFLHLCAAGVVQSGTITTLLLDADVKNRAVTDCRDLYASYQAHYEYMQNREASDAGQEPLFRCNVQMATKSAISPVPEGPGGSGRIKRLLGIANEDPEKIRAMKWFYSKEEREQNLEHGFYAHPNIGCVFFQNLVDESVNQFLDSVYKDLKVESSVNIVLVGSVFGGTGASGLPSMLKMIRSKCNSDRIHYYGILITPYFEVPKLEDSKNSKDIVIRSEDFNCNTRAALEYYKNHREFERIYLVGKKTLDQINRKYSNGGVDQDNKAHIVEVYAAMAVRDCLEKNRSKGFWSHIIDTKPVNWMELGKDMYPIANMIRTQVVLRREIYPFARTMTSERKQLWGCRQWAKVFDISSQEQLQNMESYTDDFLRWIYDLQSKIQIAKRVPDSQIELCSGFVTDFAVSLNIADPKQLDKGNGQTTASKSRSVLGQFNKLIDTVSNIEYVFNKFSLILSCLGVVNQRLASLGFVGILIKLFELAGQEKKSH